MIMNLMTLKKPNHPEVVKWRTTCGEHRHNILEHRVETFKTEGIKVFKSQWASDGQQIVKDRLGLLEVENH